MSKQADPKQAFIDTLTVLATKLNKSEYDKVTAIMYSLHCGVTCGYNVADPTLLPTFDQIWNMCSEKRVKNKANVKIFKVYENAKFKQKK